jgi:hypothetical protein
MKKAIVAGCLSALVLATAAVAASQGVGAGARYHVSHSAFAELPYDDGDLSYSLMYMYGNDVAEWQVVADWAPSVSGLEGVDSAFSPQLNLVFKDGIVRAGGGVLSTYLDGDDSDWLDPYWQFLLGLAVPVRQGMGIEAYAFYTFEDGGDLDQFDVGDIEGGAWLTYRF